MLVGCSAWISMSPTKGQKKGSQPRTEKADFGGGRLAYPIGRTKLPSNPEGSRFKSAECIQNRKTCSWLGFSYICCSFWIPGFGRSISLPQKYSPSHGHNFITEPAQKWLVDINPGRNVPQTVPNSNQCPILAVIFKMLLRAT